MKIKKVYEIQTESYIEEQDILTKLPDAVWINLDGRTRFFVSESDKEKIEGKKGE